VTQTTGYQMVSISPAKGAILALTIALPASLAPVLIFNVLVLVGGGLMLNNAVELSGWVTVCCLAFCGSASIVTSLTDRRVVNRPARVMLLVILTEMLGLLFMPIVVAIWSAPGAMNGGAMPCIHISEACRAGLHGLDAVGGLVTAAFTWYYLAIVLIPLETVAATIPAVAWDRMMVARVSSSTYHRS
jgi:hypothetical protein